MHLSLTSISGIAFSSESFESATLQTEAGVITVLPGHEAIISALSPGVAILRHDGRESRYALGGGVLEVSTTEVRILADMIEDGGHDLWEITARKLATATSMAEYRAGQSTMTMDEFVELEQSYLRDIAREQLTQK